MKKVPALQVVYGSHFYEFSMDPEPRLDCEKIIDRWKNLLAGESVFCTFAAFLQNFDDGPPEPELKEGSVWIINQLKSAKGRWTFEEGENWSKYTENDDSQLN